MDVTIAGMSNAHPAQGIFLPAYSRPEDEKSGKIHAFANCQSWLGRTLLAEHKNEEAVQILEQSIALMDQNSKAEAEVILLPDTLEFYASALRAIHRIADAEKAEARAKEMIRLRRLVLDGKPAGDGVRAKHR